MIAKKIGLFIVLVVFLAGFLAADFSNYSMAEEGSSVNINTPDKEAERVKLLGEIEEYKNQIKELESNIEEKKKEQKTLSRELSIVAGQIKKQEVEIKKTKLYINQLKLDVADKEKSKEDLESKARLERIKLKGHLSKINEYDNVGMMEMVLRYENLSDFFVNVTAIENLQKETYKILQEISDIKDDLNSQIESLEEDQVESLQLQSMLELQKFSLDQKEKEKKNLITKTKGQEKKFQELIIQNKKKITDIQSKLFEFGSLGVGRVTIEKAINYAKVAGNQTGIRPAFLLGLIWVESRLNGSLGTGNWKTDLYDCYINLGKRSIAEAQKSAFMDITYKLMLDPDKVPVSRALLRVGCGGAMGVAQFMPSTWSSYEHRISKLSGNNPPSPWNVLDGFVGSAIKLADNGATSQDRAGERKAAAMYYAGKNWQKASGQGYADRVRTAAACYQDYVDALNKGEQNIDIDSDCEKYF